MGIHQGTGNILIAKINASANSFENGNTNASTNQLTAFINQVNA